MVTMDAMDPKREEENTTDPGRRLRRLMTGGEGDGEVTPPKGTPNDAAQTSGARPQHPTGDPLQTGGWYGENDQPFPPLSPAQAQTVPVEPGQDPNAATTVNNLPPGEARTVPPAQYPPAQAPLLQQVDQIDPHATQVTPAAYTPPAYPPAGGARPPSRPPTRPQSSYPPSSQPSYPTRPSNVGPVRPPQTPSTPPRRPVEQRPTKKPAQQSDNRKRLGCVLRILITFLFGVVILILGAGTFVVFQYLSIAATLPDVDDLRARASKFETTRILDREGKELYQILDPTAGRRTFVKLDKISPYMIAATIATEDKEFYNNPGFDPVAIARALLQNYTTGEVVSGASTITQQLARSLLLSPSERGERTVQRKAREIVLAAEITRRYSKEEILELYLNEIYFGNLAYGVEAAAQTYFNTSAQKLTLAQASFLAGLPQSPAVYDIFTNREATLYRHKQVLELMYRVSQEKKCIEVSTGVEPVCVDAASARLAAQQVESYTFQPNRNQLRYPHWVNYIRSELERMYDPQTIYRSGFTVTTTIDPRLQDAAEQLVRTQVQALAANNVKDGALIAIRPSTGEILAMVGSADFYNAAISGQVNMAISPRQPGSAIKPLTYTAAFEKGWTPATLIWDVPTKFAPSGDPNDENRSYEPVNYDGRFHGPVTARDALANSYNIPAVKTLQFVGVYKDPTSGAENGFVSFAKRMGITTLTRPDYGLALTLGGGEVTLLELTSAYSIYANSGMRIPPVSILRIVDASGQEVLKYEAPLPDPVIRPEHAFLITSILSDNAARAPMFGPNSPLNLPFPAAAKTGTTNDYHDNWTLGYTPNLAVGVWVGNADYTPMYNTTGVTGAAPIWSSFMQFAVPLLSNNQYAQFTRPAGMIDKIICSVSGSEPSEKCPEQRAEIFLESQPPLPKQEDLWQRVQVDTWTALRVSSSCSEFIKEMDVINVKDKAAISWIKKTDQGRAWAEGLGFSEPLTFTPQRECRLEDPHVTVAFVGLEENQKITSGPLDIYAVVSATNYFEKFHLEYGKGDDPNNWTPLLEDVRDQFSTPEKIYTWDLSKKAPKGKVTLRLYVDSTEGTYAERRIHLDFDMPTQVPTETLEPTETPYPTETMEPTWTPEPTMPPTEEPTPEPTL